MSWISRFLFGAPASAGNVLATPTVIPPFSPTPELAALVYTDIYGSTALDIVTRETAMMVAPIKRGRAVIIGRTADLVPELGRMVDGEFVADPRQPAWLGRTLTPQTCWHRQAWTFDDVLFTGWALWIVERDASGAIHDAARMPRHRWTFDTNSPTGISIDQQPVTDPATLMLFQGPDDGLLTTAADTVRGWRSMERSWVGRVKNPTPVMVLHEVETNGVTQDEAQAYVDAWAKARTSENGAIGFLPASLNLETYGEVVADLFDLGRNAARIDAANHMNLPVSYVDGSTATASLTYVTQEGDRNALVDDLEYWIAPIENRLSQADITGDATKVIRFNRSNLTATPNDTHGATATPDPKEVTAA